MPTMVPLKCRSCVAKHSVSLTPAKCSSREVSCSVASDHQLSGKKDKKKNDFIKEIRSLKCVVKHEIIED